MTQLLAYSVIFGLTFLVVGGLTALAWAMTERKPSGEPGTHHMLQRERLSTLSMLSGLLKRLQITSLLKKLIEEADWDGTVGRLTLACLTAFALTLAILSRFDWIPSLGVWL